MLTSVSETSQQVIEFYSDIWVAHGLASFILALTASYCCLAHCVLQPLCTCRKRTNKLDKSIFKSKSEPFRIVGAHRGGSKERAENTLSAFLNAVSQGCNYMEIDVMRTKDDVIICCHDANLQRLTGLDVEVSETNFADLPPLRSPIPDDYDPESYEIREKDDAAWLELDRLFTSMPSGIMYSLDLKRADKRTAELVSRIIDKHRMQRNVVWGASYPDTHAYLKEL